MDNLKFNVDGSARGNPGPAGIRGVLRDSKGKVLFVLVSLFCLGFLFTCPALFCLGILLPGVALFSFWVFWVCCGRFCLLVEVWECDGLSKCQKMKPFILF